MFSSAPANDANEALENAMKKHSMEMEKQKRQTQEGNKRHQRNIK